MEAQGRPHKADPPSLRKANLKAKRTLVDHAYQEIRHRILAALALLPARVVLLAPGTLPRTSSGKLRRAEAARLLLAGALRPPSRLGALRLAREWGRSRLAWMRSRLRRTAPPPLDGETDRA